MVKMEEILPDSIPGGLLHFDPFNLAPKKQILTFNEKLTAAENSINQAQNSLQKANESFKQYERESKAEKKQFTWQRNVAGLVAVVLALR